MNDLIRKQHLHRIRQETTSKLGRADVVEWILKNTTIAGKPFSFKNHEYQQKILEDQSREKVIIKAAQVGISELQLREVSALTQLMGRGFSTIYTFPTASFAASYSKSRFDPIVAGSPVLKASMSEGSVSNSEVKEFSGERFVYFRGSAVGNAAISVAADYLVFDELSFSDPVIIGDYQSRLLHSSYRMRTKLSTPTYPGDPIDMAFKASRRHFNFCRCNRCSHFFIPDYYEHVRIPDYAGDLAAITKDNLHKIRFKDASLHCPKCGRVPSLQPEHREWVIENPDEPHIAAGFQVSPFDAPNIVTVPYLIEASTGYANKSKFMQFSLGKPAMDADAGLTEEDIDAYAYELVSSPFHTHVLGVDLGTYCHFVIGGLDGFGRLHVVHYERCPVGKFRETYERLSSTYRVTLKVSDTQPYVETVLQMQKDDPNLYGAFYVVKQGLELFAVKVREEDSQHALADLRQVNVNRNAVLDKIMGDVRDGNILVAKRPDYDTFKSHVTDMKRASATLRNGEFTSNWVKSVGGQDHYHHGLLYCWIAAQLRGLSAVPFSGLNMGVQKFKVKQGA